MQKSLVGRLEVGTRIILTNEKFNGMKATVKYVGPLDSTVEWIGVELDEEKGSHSGEYKNKSYFTCKPNHGAFVKAGTVTTLEGVPIEEHLLAAGSEIKKEPPKKIETKPDKPEAPKTKLPEPKDAKDPKEPTKKPVPSTTTGGAKVPANRATVVTRKPEEKDRLANELDNAMNSEIKSLKDELNAAHEIIKDLRENTNYAEITKLREQVSQLETERRELNLAKELIENKVETEREQKAKDLVEEITFYKNEKEKAEKDKKKMEGRLKALEASLEEEAGKEELILKLSQKCESLEAKCEGFRLELDNARTEIKNSKLSGQSTEGSTADKDIKDYLLEIETLNETVVLLESELNEEKSRREAIEKETAGSSDKLKEFAKIEKLLKRKEADIVELKEALEQSSDAVAFAEQLSMKKLRVEEELQQAKTKINELLADKDIMEQLQQSQDEIGRELEHYINERDSEIEKLLQKIKEKDSEITDHLKQNAKLKEKVIALLKQVESNSARRLESEQQQEQLRESALQSPTYNNIQYLEVMRHCEQTNEKYLKLQEEFSQVKNKVGVYILNIQEALPGEFRDKFYPEGIDLLIAVKTARDKLYYLFETVFAQLRERNELYSEENAELANWMLMLMGRIEKASHNLFRLELLLSVCETEEELANIVTRRVFKEQALFMETFAGECLAKFADNSVSVAITFDQFDQALRTIEDENSQLQGALGLENDMKLRMSSESMGSVLYAMEMVLNFKLLSELKENAPLDSTLEGYLKRMSEYLRELCLNSHIRYRPHMQNYLDGLKFISEMFKDFEAENLILFLENLNAEREEIKLLKNVLIQMQAYIKELQVDLEEMQFSDELKKLQTRLTGGLWRKRIDLIRDELTRVRQLTEQKNDLEAELVEAKKKIVIQDKDLKDKGVVKEVLEKRIGELQLRVEQISGLEAEIKRLNEKIKNAEDGGRALEEELDSLLKKNTQVNEEYKKLKEKFDAHAILGQQKQAARSSVQHTLSIDSVPVKNILKENSVLRNVHLKERIVKLRYSPVLQIDNPATADPYKKLRRQTLASLVDSKIVVPGEKTDSGRTDQLLLSIQNIAKYVQSAASVKLVYVGTVRVDIACAPTSLALDRLLYGKVRSLVPASTAQS